MQETIRNLYFHVFMWFTMMILFAFSVIYALNYLNNNELKYDIYSRHFAGVGMVFGVLGYATWMNWMSITQTAAQSASWPGRKSCIEQR